MTTIVRTDAVSNAIAKMIRDNGSKWMGVTFVKKNGEVRTLNCHVRTVKGHTGHNNASHVEKYVTVVLNEKDEKGNEQFRNVNMETVVSLSIAGRKISFQ
ncbi:hypothetical protein phiPsa267_165 [Pseudomonas phage phiPsa267]|uniref:Uncharacterized protein n=8 Tax=Otagovirus TaxID=2560197 RepID=A0A7G9V107_9CAUD|nr:hypothetical protein CF96_gp062 [Pseudomonas phage phiPsa374]YP_010766893.1 hypothetical protein QGX14_gp068 [Pseudomonas phage psageK4]YP_010767086.1 hypothetical protein QGX15_gp066 [Pseudomonas phage psageK4e]YP_010767252.1 hypothetical protein QGX16_gp063 [Pseudomonas phage phiPsa397]YP_010767424.1 hypothetical protein QGX17_gp063 [Pseudomonas phage phiPsa381]YP_010767599.1 hypothetical protein QGX18_gp065 [Pseudomonas phage phiPsa347]YP_010767775.1 hypothetical protein QGX19_gp065 [Ps